MNHSQVSPSGSKRSYHWYSLGGKILRQHLSGQDLFVQRDMSISGEGLFNDKAIPITCGTIYGLVVYDCQARTFAFRTDDFHLEWIWSVTLPDGEPVLSRHVLGLVASFLTRIKYKLMIRLIKPKELNAFSNVFV